MAVFARASLRMDRRSSQQSAIEILERYTTVTDIYHARKLIAEEFVHQSLEVPLEDTDRYIEKASQHIEKQFRCYAGLLHIRHGRNSEMSDKIPTPGYAPEFNHPIYFPGRMEKEARRVDLLGKSRAAKPWLNHSRRIILIGDMGDIFSDRVPFEFLRQEIIEIAASKNGRRHIWLLPTRNPPRMAEFQRRLKSRGITWPANLVPMTSVTNQSTLHRVDELKMIQAPIRAIWAQPLLEPLELDLTGISWVIVGGEAGRYARPFDLHWAEGLYRQCKAAKVAFFLSQLGSRPVHGGTSLSPTLAPGEKLDPHGANMEQWPEAAIKVREIPASFLRAAE